MSSEECEDGRRVGRAALREVWRPGMTDAGDIKTRRYDRWVLGVSVAGVLVSALVLVIVLFPLLDYKSHRYVLTPLDALDPADLLARGTSLDQPISPEESFVAAEDLVALAGEVQGRRTQDTVDVWDTVEAQQFYKVMAENLGGAMNNSADPCGDFYEYACGNWGVHRPIPKGVSRWSNFEAMTIKIWDMMEDELERAAAAASRSARFQDAPRTPSHFLLQDADPFVLGLVGRYYSACEDEDQLDALGVTPLVEVLTHMDDTYTHLANTTSPLEAFQALLEHVHFELVVHAFFSWKVEMDNSVANSMALEVTAPSLDLIPQGTIVEGNEELEGVYRQVASGLLELVGPFSRGGVAAEVDDILAMLSVFQPLAGSPLVNDTTVAELSQIAPFLDWHRFLNKGFNEVGTFVGENERVLSLVQEYLAEVSRHVLQEVSQHGSADRLYVFLRWQVAQYYAQFLHRRARNTILPLFDGITGETTTALPHFRYRPCIKELEERMALPIAYLLLEIIQGQLHKGHNIKRMIDKVSQMAEYIREEYKLYINTFTWLDADERRFLVDKLTSANILVGYPPLLNDIPLLRKTFKGLTLTPDNLLQNQVNLRKFNQVRMMRFLRQPDTYTEWEVLSPMSLISFYVYRRNTLLVPLGGFMYPLYSAYIPEGLAYATMGVFVSHELGHAVDFVGRTRDQHGRANASLWGEDTVAKFVEKVLCRVNEYSENHYPINGLLTIAEVMADDGSVVNAYNTARHLLHDAKMPAHLQGFMAEHDLTVDQLFFLFYAQLFCTATHDGSPAQGVEHYPPHSARVTATLTKLPAFHQAFGCGLHTPMHPTDDHCHIW